MKTKLYFWMVLALLAGLVFSSPAQAQEPGVATFIFTSSLNPSAAYQEVTFTVSATGTYPGYQPFGYVNFYDNGALISGCSQVALNFPNGIPTPDKPAVCTTRLTAQGEHTITADFSSSNIWAYPHATVTLEGGQTVSERLPVTFDPLTLDDGIYGTYYSQNITPTCAGGNCQSVWWSSEPWVPVPGMNFQPSTPAKLAGIPAAVGVFSFTVTAVDGGSSGASGSHSYTWNVQKATPVVTLQRLPSNEGWLYLHAYVTHPNLNWAVQPAGLASIFLDDDPLAGCSEMEVVPGFGGSVVCYTQIPAGLQPGSHTLRAVFTPDAASSANYNGGSRSLPLNVPFSITGLIFEDLDQDGVRDEGEGPLYHHKVDLDHGCDGTIDTWASTGYQGLFTFPSVTLGDTYCLRVESYGSWRVTTALEPFTAAAGDYFEIGVHYVELAISPQSLPNGSVGAPYFQEISISGGTGPYTFVSTGAVLPEGITFDQETLTVSGTPEEAGFGLVYLFVKDAENIIGIWQLEFYITTDGLFTLVSDANPSAPGQEVTFTFSGAGDVVDPYNTPISPFGMVAFYDEGDLIPGCESVQLNNDPRSEMEDQPAVCTTSALAEGSHEIQAVFTSGHVVYRDAILTMAHDVQSIAVPTADLSIDKTDSKDPVKPGAKLVYTLTIRNTGPDAAQNLTLVDTPDRNTTYVSTSTSKDWTCTYVNYKVTCTSAGLASGSTAIIKITVTVNRDAKVGKELVNNASVSSDILDPDLLNNTVVQKTMVIK